MPAITREEIARHLPEINQLTKTEWRDAVYAIWVEAYGESAWTNLTDVPFSVGAPEVSLVNHVRMVAKTALELAKNIRELMGKPCDDNTVLLLSLLHDVCKVVEMEPDPEHPGKPRKSHLGKTCQHGFMSGYYARKRGFSDDIVGELIAHSGASKVLPATSEGLCMYYADMGAADQAFFHASRPLLLHK